MLRTATSGHELLRLATQTGWNARGGQLLGAELGEDSEVRLALALKPFFE